MQKPEGFQRELELENIDLSVSVPINEFRERDALFTNTHGNISNEKLIY